MCFLTLEDETGTSNAAVIPQIFQKHRTLIHTAALLLVEGPLQNVEGVVHAPTQRRGYAPIGGRSPCPL